MLSSLCVRPFSHHYQALEVLCTKQTKQTDFFFPSLSPSRFLDTRLTGVLLTGLKGPRHPAHQVLLTPSQSRQVESDYKINQLQFLSGNADHSCGWTVKPIDPLVARETSIALCFLWGQTGWPRCFYVFSSLDCDGSLNTATQVLRFHIIFRGSRWLETVSWAVPQAQCCTTYKTVLHWFCFVEILWYSDH